MQEDNVDAPPAVKVSAVVVSQVKIQRIRPDPE
jgi:hypothetical protein